MCASDHRADRKFSITYETRCRFITAAASAAAHTTIKEHMPKARQNQALTGGHDAGKPHHPRLPGQGITAARSSRSG